MKKVISLMVVAALMATLLTGCSDDYDAYEASATNGTEYYNEQGSETVVHNMDDALGFMSAIAEFVDFSMFGGFADVGEFVDISGFVAIGESFDYMFADSAAVLEAVTERVEALDNEQLYDLMEELAIIAIVAADMVDALNIISEDEIAVMVNEFNAAMELMEDIMNEMIELLVAEFEDVIDWEAVAAGNFYELAMELAMLEFYYSRMYPAEDVFPESMAIIEEIAVRIEAVDVEQWFLLLDWLYEVLYDIEEQFYGIITDAEIDIIMNEFETAFEHFAEELIFELEMLAAALEEMIDDLLVVFEEMAQAAVMDALDLIMEDMSNFDLGDFDLSSFGLDGFDLNDLESLLTDEFLDEILQNFDVADLLMQIMLGN